MRIGDWLTKDDIRVLAPAGVSSVLAGVAAAFWLQLPAELSEPVVEAYPRLISAEDPGRARYMEVVASLGGIAATYTPRTYFPAAPIERASVEDYPHEDAYPYELAAYDHAYGDEAWRESDGYAESRSADVADDSRRRPSRSDRRLGRDYAHADPEFDDRSRRRYGERPVGGYVYSSGYAYEPRGRRIDRPAPTYSWRDEPRPPPPPRPEFYSSAPVFYE